MQLLTDKLWETLTRIDGCKFRGQLSPAPVIAGRDAVPYRMLRVRMPCLVKPGDVIVDKTGDASILLAHPNEFDWCRDFKVAFTMGSYPWQRPVKEQDPVAHIERSFGFRDMGVIYCNFDQAALVSFGGFKDAQYRFLTGQPIEVGDLVDNRKVKTITQILGVNVAEAV